MRIICALESYWSQVKWTLNSPWWFCPRCAFWRTSNGKLCSMFFTEFGWLFFNLLISFLRYGSLMFDTIWRISIFWNGKYFSPSMAETILSITLVTLNGPSYFLCRPKTWAEYPVWWDTLLVLVGWSSEKCGVLSFIRFLLSRLRISTAL